MQERQKRYHNKLIALGLCRRCKLPIGISTSKYLCQSCRNIENNRSKKYKEPTYRQRYKVIETEYRRNHQAETTERNRKWRKDNPEKAAHLRKKHHYLRDMREKVSTGNYTDSEWNHLLLKYNYTCLSCGRRNIKLTVDHIIPLSRGGTNDISNIQPLCMECNNRKHTQTIDFRPTDNSNLIYLDAITHD